MLEGTQIALHINAIAERAAGIHGQNWGALPVHSRERWMMVVKDVINVGGRGDSSPMEQAASQAVREWREANHV